MSVPDLQPSCRHLCEASTSAANDCDFSSGCRAWPAADPGYAIRPAVHSSRDDPGPPALLRSADGAAVWSLSVRCPSAVRNPGQPPATWPELQSECNPGEGAPGTHWLPVTSCRRGQVQCRTGDRAAIAIVNRVRIPVHAPDSRQCQSAVRTDRRCRRRQSPRRPSLID